MDRLSRVFAAMAALLLTLSCSAVVFAAESTTTIKLSVDAKSSYELIIPASTSVTDFGWTDLASNLKVKGTISSAKAVDVTIDSANDFRFVNADSNKSIVYTLRETQAGAAVTQIHFGSADVTVSGDPGKPLGVFVERDAWNAVPGGDYSDVLVFSAQLTDSNR